MKENRPVIIAFLLLLAFMALGMWLGNEYVAREQQRDMQNWESRLAVIAESQKRVVESWLKLQQSNLQELADNPLLQILLSMRQDAAGESNEAQRGQLSHLKNLVVATASRAGVFASAQEINANQQTRLDEGVGVTDADGKLLLSTQQFPAADENIRKAVLLAIKKQRGVVYGIYRNDQQQPRLLLAVPVNAVQAGPGTTAYPGAVVAVINPQTKPV